MWLHDDGDLSPPASALHRTFPSSPLILEPEISLKYQNLGRNFQQQGTRGILRVTHQGMLELLGSPKYSTAGFETRSGLEPPTFFFFRPFSFPCPASP